MSKPPAKPAAAPKTAAKAAPARNDPIADLRDWWDSSVAWVNSHWLQIGIAIAAGLAIYFLLSDYASEVNGVMLDVNGGDWVAA